MLGWHISIYRLDGLGAGVARGAPPDKTALRRAADAPGQRIAVWQTGLRGLDWIDRLVEQGRVIADPGSGYPDRFFGPASALFANLLDGSPDAKPVWGHDPGDVLGPRWEGVTSIDRVAAGECGPDDWLLVEAWDES